MGLAVSVGYLAELLQFDPEGAEAERIHLAHLNEVLVEYEIQSHNEPETLPELDHWSRLASFPYKWIHYLRRFAAHVIYEDAWRPKPVPKGSDPLEDPAYEEALTFYLDSHLICHSDAEGYYLPLPFEELVVDRKGTRILGDIAGSSYKLMEELRWVAGPLGIPVYEYPFGPELKERLNAIAQDTDPFHRVRAVWFVLFDAARLSLEHNTAIRFS